MTDLKFIDVNGVRTAYRFDGPKDAPVLMLSNSLMSTHRMWDPQMTAFTRHHRVLRYDTRGHGSSQTTPGPYSIERLAEDAAALIDSLVGGPVHFLGLSMGGMIGQRLAVSRPDLVNKLVLCDTASIMPTPEMWNGRISTAEQNGLEALVGSTIKRWFTEPFIQASPAAIGFVEGMIRDTDAPGYIACAKAIRDMNQTHILKDIKARTLVLIGALDPACTPQQGEVLHAHIPAAETVTIEDAAHLSNIEKPTEFNEAVLSFLTE